MNVLVDFVPEQMPWLFAGIAVRHDDIAARRELLARFLRASIEGSYMALSRRQNGQGGAGEGI